MHNPQMRPRPRVLLDPPQMPYDRTQRPPSQVPRRLAPTCRGRELLGTPRMDAAFSRVSPSRRDPLYSSSTSKTCSLLLNPSVEMTRTFRGTSLFSVRIRCRSMDASC